MIENESSEIHGCAYVLGEELTLLNQAAICFGLRKVVHYEARLPLGQTLHQSLKVGLVGIIRLGPSLLNNVPAINILTRSSTRLRQRKSDKLVGLFDFQLVVECQQLVTDVDSGLKSMVCGR